MSIFFGPVQSLRLFACVLFNPLSHQITQSGNLHAFKNVVNYKSEYFYLLFEGLIMATFFPSKKQMTEEDISFCKERDISYHIKTKTMT